MARTEVRGGQIKDGTIGLTDDVTGILPVANGGTGSNTLTSNNVLLGNGTGAVQAVAPGTSGNVLTSNGSTWQSAAPFDAATVSNDTTLDVVPAKPRTYVEDTGLTGAVTVTAQAGAVGWLLWVSLVGTAARAITWDSGDFEDGPTALPTTTVTTERLDTLCVWNTATSKWRCMSTGSAA